MKEGRAPARPAAFYHDAHRYRTGLSLRARAVFAAGVLVVLLLSPIRAQASSDCTPLPSDAVSWWPADGHAEDMVGPNHAALFDNAGYAPGKVGYAFSLDGSGDYVNIPHHPSFDTMTSDLTIEAWVKVSSFPHLHSTIISKGDSSWRVQRSAGSNEARFGTNHPGFNDQDGTTNINDGDWHHVAATFTGGTKRLYVDGSEDATAQTGLGNISTNAFDVRIGDNSEFSGRFWDGLIDEVTLYDRALSATEVQGIYDAGDDGKCRPAVITVNTQADTTADDGFCSLREAITSANTEAASGAMPGECAAGLDVDTISVPAGTYTPGSSLIVSSDIYLDGADEATTIIDGQDAVRPFEATGTSQLLMSHLTITNGLASSAGGALKTATGALILDNVTISSSSASPGGGGLNSNGTVLITNSTITGNSAGPNGAGGILLDGGGNGTLINSTVSGNSTTGGGDGGGVYSTGDLTVMGSTVSGNTSSGNGGGIVVAAGPTATIENSTISGNSASNGGGLDNQDGTTTLTNVTITANGGIAALRTIAGSVTTTNTIVAKNTGGSCDGTPTSGGHNLEGGTGCGFTGTGDIQSTDPLLGPLADNGGPTQTHALSKGSPAVDKGDDSACPDTDQRGEDRPFDGDTTPGAVCDIGAYERQASTPQTFTVTSNNDVDDNACTTAHCSLREAVRASNANAGADTIEVPADTYNLTTTGAEEDAAATGDLDLTDNVTITGEGAASTIIDANDIDRIFHVLSGTTVDISGVTIRNGTGNTTASADPTNGWGGGIYNAGSLTLTDTIVTENTALNGDPDTFQGRGGGIYNNAGSLVLDGSSVTDNTAPTSSGLSGGIFSALGTLTLTDSEVSLNTAGAQAAGVEADGTTVSITGSTISENDVDGGAALAAGISAEGGSFSLINSTVSGNFVTSGSAFAGGIFYRDMSPTITNSTIANNTGNSGGIHRGSGPDVVATNVIVSGNSSPECNSTITSTAGSNLESGTACFQAGDLQTSNPLLGALAYNGGPTKTHALGAGSPAIDAGTNTGCPAHDQRGGGRSVAAGGDGMCDIGSYEFGSGATFTVTSSDDVSDGSCTPAHCSLREAILVSNASSGDDTIEFDLPGTGPFTISPQSFALPTITDPVTIDGYSEDGALPASNPAATIMIELDGTSAGGGVDGLKITAANSTVRGLVIDRFASDGIEINGAGATGNVIEGNYIGVGVDGLTDLGNGAAGVYIVNGASNNVVGGTTVAERNVISGNGAGGGVTLQDASSSGNDVVGNYIGTNAAGTSSIPNAVGVVISNAAGNNIGTGQSGGRNLISGNTFHGVDLIDDDRAGGTFDATGNEVLGNYIGTDAAGTDDVPNGVNGVVVNGASTTTVGGTNAAARNVISGNAGSGLVLNNSATGTVVQGNYVGVGSGGASLPNLGNGIDVTPGSFPGASNNTVGGTGAGEGNVVANNDTGIRIADGTGATFSGNSIFDNGDLGIDLVGGTEDANGVTANDVDPGAGTTDDNDSGPNNLQNSPVITDVSTTASTTAHVTLNSTPGGTFIVDFYSSDGCDPSGYGEGQSYLGSSTQVTDGNGDGDFSFPTTLTPTVEDGDVVTATATNVSTGDTSEFSACRLVGPLVVNSTDDDTDANTNDLVCDTGQNNSAGDPECTLRAAIVQANASSGVDEIEFDVPGATDAGCAGTAGEEVCTIAPGGALPFVLDDLKIDGYTQAGASEAASAADIKIQIDGAGTVGGADGLSLRDETDVRGLAIYGFPNGRGIVVSGSGVGGAADGSVIAGNHIGTDAAGTVDLGNAAEGVLVNASSVTVGGSSVADRNVISGNGGDGVKTALDNQITIRGNYIGLGADGTTDVGNSGAGVNITGGNGSATIGGTTSGARNVISGNGDSGIVLSDVNGGHTIQGNYIGTDAAGTADRGNTLSGISMTGEGGNTIGGAVSGAGNVISGNDASGISNIGSNSGGNTIQGNYIGVNASGSHSPTAVGNSTLGIDIQDAEMNSIGGPASGAGNVISGNGTGGISITHAATTSGTTIEGNSIGTNAAGTSAIANGGDGVALAALDSNNTVKDNLVSGNTGDGVEVSGAYAGGTGNVFEGNIIGLAANGVTDLGNGGHGVLLGGSTPILVGGTTPGQGNTVSGNGLDGVAITGSATGRAVRGNSIFSNDNLGIDLADDGVTPNDPMDADTPGPNELQNFPVITSAQAGADNVQGSLNSTPVTNFTIDFYSSPACDGSGNGEGATFLDSTPVTTDGAGDVSFDITLGAVLTAGQVVTATATDPGGNTSEFSACMTVDPAPGGGGGGGGGDTDGDGIPDSTDACDNEAEDVDGFEDSDGCPDPDNDQDNIPDATDGCPNQAEDLDGFEDSDGCPEAGPGPEGPGPTLPECEANPAAHCGTDGDDTITITGDGQTWYLGAGNDTIVVTGCNNVIYLQGGNDQIILPPDCTNTVFMGDGDDSASVGGGSARSTRASSAAIGLTLSGEAGNDSLRGGALNDSLKGGPGTDFIAGFAGNDTLKGGGGPDKLKGGQGNDVLKGGGSKDSCKGGPGQDSLKSCE